MLEAAVWAGSCCRWLPESRNGGLGAAEQLPPATCDEVGKPQPLQKHACIWIPCNLTLIWVFVFFFPTNMSGKKHFYRNICGNFPASSPLVIIAGIKIMPRFQNSLLWFNLLFLLRHQRKSWSYPRQFAVKAANFTGRYIVPKVFAVNSNIVFFSK